MVSWWIVMGCSGIAFVFGMFCMALCAMARIADARAAIIRLQARVKELEERSSDRC